MKIIYDNETDNIYAKFTYDPVIESEEKNNGTIVDYNEKGDIVAVEVLKKCMIKKVEGFGVLCFVAKQ